ncbi:sugar ABC transporter substrate-binding protein [Saccharibacillus sp. CPCC 101409]|uniref:ABC transporter substrate-binding protein n=1 Tax=Saccharibacillus sp. CPCC 101409 TaxID=3058041 RepID=UPI0026727522|nr:sugar ABC transporter substrate-binding protein [Saccharibacillus sp. CPCC 101409]MDO3410122.1 sugar ABC transporter substrate-binding protein [Saccharibacillus sp. CPCC 101409]
MKKFSKLGKAAIALLLAAGTTACGSSGSDTKEGANAPDPAGTQEAAGYEFGAGKTFHSEEPVTYSMMFSDNEAYPYQESWQFWKSLKEKTNVSFDLAVTARAEYDNQKALIVNSGDAPYIIPKTYDESAFVAGGQIVPISEWTQYMPNYTEAVEKWGMADDLKVKLQQDGKYYVLPGLWESAAGGYSYVIRKDVFKKAGVDVEAGEGKWTYEDFYEALKKVKAYTGADYVWSDQYQGKSTLNIAAVEYGVTGGWGLANGLKFDESKKEFYFADASQDFKDYVTYFNKLVKDGILDPESFTQDDEAARAKFFKGETYVINGNYQFLAESMSKMQDKDSDLYMIVQPGGPKGLLQVENSRLENGVMISQNALDNLGKEGFIKMLRFVDWLWYSDEGQTFSLWGDEGDTYTKDADGKIMLNKDITYNGLNADTGKKQLNVDLGFAGGVFAYGGSDDLRYSRMTEGEQDYIQRIKDSREARPVQPPIMASQDESEEMNLVVKPLMDYVDTMTLKFITGQEDIDAGWDAYVAQVQSNGADRYVQMANEIFNNTKETLGY